MDCPNCSGSDHIIKTGKRKTKKGSVQKYRCMECGRSFSDSVDPYSNYPLRIILHSLELYNQGHSASSVKTIIGKRYKISPPLNTIYSWTKRFENDLSFIKIRKKLKLDPESIIRTKNFQHRQIVSFSYHPLKVNYQSRENPGIGRYVNWIERSLPDRIFLEGPRMSEWNTQTDAEILPLKNNLPHLTRLALERSSDPNPHIAIENFFLINDSSTVATEVPVFLNPDETQNTPIPITGHIDLLQARFGKVYVLDYKPNLNNPLVHSSQILLYREAIHRRMNIPKERIDAIVFNEHGSFEIREKQHTAMITPTPKK